jgi:hypothetical protein
MHSCLAGTGLRNLLCHPFCHIWQQGLWFLQKAACLTIFKMVKMIIIVIQVESS